MKPIILFDIDRTIFSTSKFKENTIKHFIEILSETEEKIAEAIKEYDSTLPSRDHYHPNDLAALIATKFGKNEKEMQEIFWKATHVFENSLFEDTLHALETLSKTHQLGVFSQGIDDYQMAKLTHGKIHHFFDKDLIFISRDKAHPEFLAKLPKGATIIDDKLEMIEKVAHTHAPVWLNRLTEDKHPVHPTVHNLHEFLKLFEK